MQDGHRGQESYVLDGANTGLGDEMAPNGDISIGTTGYALDNNAGDVTMTTSTEQVYGDNTQSLKLVVSSVGDGILAGISGQYLSGVTYKASAWIYTTNTVKLNPPNGWFVDDTNEVSSTATNEWTEVVCYMTSDSSSTEDTGTGLYIQTANSGTTTFYLGQLSIKPVNDKHHATTVFYGDELWDGADNSTSNWDAGTGASVAASADCLLIQTGHSSNGPNIDLRDSKDLTNDLYSFIVLPTLIKYE